MKNLIITLCLLALSQWALAQEAENFSQEQGKVTNYEMTLKEYSKDKDAEALVIYDFGDYYFQGFDTRGFVLIMKRKVKIKILKAAGTKYGNFEIPYYMETREGEDVYDINATTYNFDNGQLIKSTFDTKNIHEEKINDKWNVKRLAMSDVREGSVVEFSYTIATPYFVNMREWNFQRKIPVVHSRLTYRAIPYYEYTYIMKGANKLDESGSKDFSNDIRFRNLVYREREFTFGMKNLPAFKDEEYITSVDDYMISLNFQLSRIHFPHGGNKEYISTWPAMCDDFLKDENFGKYIKNAEKEAKKILPTLALDGKTSLDQAQAIVRHVKSKYNWDGRYGKYSSGKLSDFLKQQKGNAGDINLFLAGLLNAAKVEAYPVVLSTRKNGMIRKSYPFRQFLNYVIVMVIIDGKPYFIDGTESLLDFNELPTRCINIEGLVVKPKTEQWVNIIQRTTSLGHKELTLKIVPEENKTEVKARYAGQGYDAYNYRSTYLGKEENLVKYLKDKNNIDVKGDIEIPETAEDLKKAFVFSFSFDTALEGTEEKLFIHPFCNISISENPFKQTSRTLPVDLIYNKMENYKSTIEIPEGYKVESLPASKIIDDALVKMSYMATQTGNKITIESSYALKKNLYDAREYLSLKMSFADIVKKNSEVVILVKE